MKSWPLRPRIYMDKFLTRRRSIPVEVDQWNFFTGIKGHLYPKMSHEQTSDLKLKSHKQLVKWTSPLHRGIKDICDSYSAQKKYVLTPNEKGRQRRRTSTDYQRFAKKLGPLQSPTLNVYGLYGLFTLIWVKFWELN